MDFPPLSLPGQTRYASLDPPPAKRGIIALWSTAIAETMTRSDHSGTASMMLSVYVVDISRSGDSDMKLFQLIMTRPVSGSTSMNCLSAASRGAPASVRSALGFDEAGTSYGPVQVWP